MGDPAAKATQAAVSAAEELRYVLTVLERDPDDIWEEGRNSITECNLLLARISMLVGDVHE
jgi:hypothetical protein